MLNNVDPERALDQPPGHSGPPRPHATFGSATEDTGPGLPPPLLRTGLRPVSLERKLSELQLYAVDLGYGRPLTESGTPRMAGAGKARAILERLRNISAPYGTQIDIENGVGVIRPPGHWFWCCADIRRISSARERTLSDVVALFSFSASARAAS